MGRPPHFPKPEKIVKIVVWINIAVFTASILLSGRATQWSLNPFTALSPSINSLIFLGATGRLPIDQYHQWSSLITANWLHGSLLHLLFNMTAFFQITPFVIREFGFHRMVIIYNLSGVFGFLLSYLAGVMVTIGASAAICGLIGATLFFGKSRGGFYGQAVYKQTSGWVIGLVIFGFLIPNINNWGHGGGLAAGIFLGWILGYNEKKRETFIHRILSWSLMGLTAVILAQSLLSALFVNFT